MLHEFDMEIQDKKGTMNMVANYLSRITDVESGDVLINDYSTYDRMTTFVRAKAPRYAHITDFLEADDSGFRKTHEEVADVVK